MQIFELFTNFRTGPVVQKVDNAIHWINHYSLDSAIIIGFPNTLISVG